MVFTIMTSENLAEQSRDFIRERGWKRHDLRSMRELAKEGDAWSQFARGIVLHAKGKHVEAAAICELAAENGLGDAAHHTALLYRYGIGVPERADKQELFLLQAIENRFPMAKLDLGVLYLQQGKFRDAVVSLRGAARLRQPEGAEATLYVSVLYDFGLGVKFDPEKSRKWRSDAPVHEYGKALYNIATVVEDSHKHEAALMYAGAAIRGVEQATESLADVSSKLDFGHRRRSRRTNSKTPLNLH